MKKRFRMYTAFTAAFLLALTACVSAPPDLSSVTTYYVSEKGRDKNSGVTEAKPFKTLTKAITQAATTPVKTITVIGTLTTACEIKNITSSDEILIVGKQGQAAVINGTTGRGLMVDGIKLRLENISITGRGMTVDNSAVVTLGAGVKITGSKSMVYGGGLYISGSSTVVMESNAEISKNYAGYGGGVYISGGGSLVMKNNAVIKGNWTNTDLNNGQVRGGYGGGIYIRDNSSLVIQDNASLSDNTAYRDRRDGKNYAGYGGGICALNSATVTLQDNAVITENVAGYAGGGIDLDNTVVLVMKGNSRILKNYATGQIWDMSKGEYLSDTDRNGGYGGGVCIEGTAKLSLQDTASITGNTAYNSGGGVYVDDTAIYEPGAGTVSDNKAANGPDVYQEAKE